MFEKTQTELRADICEIGRRVWQKGFVAYNDGNLSIRLNEREVLATPTGVSKGFLTPDMLVVVDLDGNQLDGHLKMSSEILMHLAMYKERCDIGAVVHVHPPHATGFAVYGEGFDRPTLPESWSRWAACRLAPYGKPSTPELGESVKPYVADHDVFLLQNHGTLALGKDIHQAYYRTETLELSAQITFIARMLGKENVIPEEEIPHLVQMRRSMGLDYPRSCLTFQPGSNQPVQSAGGGSGDAELEGLVQRVAERVVRELRK